MPQNPYTLSIPMKRVLAFVQDKFPNDWFYPGQIPLNVLHHAYTNTLNALVERGQLEVNEKGFYRLKTQEGRL